MQSRRRGTVSFILWYLPVLVVQWISGRITTAGIDPWYKALEKPAWTPPGWIFGPVWTVLYLMMAAAVWQVSSSRYIPSRKKNLAYLFFFTQLILNGLWSWLFFGSQMIGWALLNLLLLTLLVAATTLMFYRLKSLAGWLFAPYLLWIIYATSLNAAIWWLNL